MGNTTPNRPGSLHRGNRSTRRALPGSGPDMLERLEDRRLFAASAAVQITSTQFVFRESDGAALITVARIGEDTTGDFAVDYTTADGTAVAGLDYQATSGQLTFTEGGPTVQTILVPLIDDVGVNPDLSFSVVLGDVTPTGTNPNFNAVVVAPESTQVVITNDDVAFQFSQPTYSFNAFSQPTATVTVQRLGILADTVQVDYTSAGGPGSNGAAAGVDFTPVTGTLEFLPGETSKTISVPLLANGTSPVTKTVVLSLSNPRVVVPPGVNPSSLTTQSASVQGFPIGFTPAQPLGTTVLNVEQVDTRPLQLTPSGALSDSGITFNLDPKGKKVSSLTLHFNKPLDQGSAQSPNSYAIFSRTNEGPAGVGRRSGIGIRSATYLPATNDVVLVTQQKLALNKTYQFIAFDTNGVTDVARNAIDGDYSGAPGGNFSMLIGRGTKLTYTDFDGDIVTLNLKGGGTIDLREKRNAAATASITNVVLQGASPASILTGTVKAKFGGNGLATIDLLQGGTGVNNQLASPPFSVVVLT